jgi:hypothetical protein
MKQGSSQPPVTPRTQRVQSATANSALAIRGRLAPPTPSPAQTSAESQVGSSPTRPLRPAMRNANAHSSQTPHPPRRHDNTLAATPSGLESLLSAARSVLDPGSQEGSPSKRRRIDSTPDAEARSDPARNDGAGRAMSALDVLADQAAAFGSHSDSTSAESTTSPPQPSRITRGVTFPSLDSSRSRIEPKGKSRARGFERSTTEPQTQVTPSTLGPAFTLRTAASETTPKPHSTLQPPVATLSDPPSPMGPPQSSSPLQSRYAPEDSPTTPRPMRGLGFSTSSDVPSSATSSQGPAGDTLTRISGEISSKRPRSPYVKWTKEEDDLLSKVRG